ncbi:MAG: hypothetical protein QOJ60_584 [Actinomycetota bacterium]|nr:hypothetical protein [Actinomycetota bacterium]
MVVVRPAHPEDDAALSAIDTAAWSTQVSPAPPPTADSPFFNDRVAAHDVLVNGLARSSAADTPALGARTRRVRSARWRVDQDHSTGRTGGSCPSYASSSTVTSDDLICSTAGPPTATDHSSSSSA